MIQTGRKTNRSRPGAENRKNTLIEGAKVNHKEGRLTNLEFLNRIVGIRFEEGEDLDDPLQSDDPLAEHSTGENEDSEVDNSSHNIAAYVSRVPEIFVNVPLQLFTPSRSSTPTVTTMTAEIEVPGRGLSTSGNTMITTGTGSGLYHIQQRGAAARISTPGIVILN